MRWSRSRDEKMRVNIAVQWRFDRDDLANLLAARLISTYQFTYGDTGNVGVDEYDERRDRRVFRVRLPAVRVEAAIREQLRDHGEDSRHWWTDKVEDYPGEPSADEIRAWCQAQVSQL